MARSWARFLRDVLAGLPPIHPQNLSRENLVDLLEIVDEFVEELHSLAWLKPSLVFNDTHGPPYKRTLLLLIYPPTRWDCYAIGGRFTLQQGRLFGRNMEEINNSNELIFNFMKSIVCDSSLLRRREQFVDWENETLILAETFARTLEYVEHLSKGARLPSSQMGAPADGTLVAISAEERQRYLRMSAAGAVSVDVRCNILRPPPGPRTRTPAFLAGYPLEYEFLEESKGLLRFYPLPDLRWEARRTLRRAVDAVIDLPADPAKQ